MDLLELSKKDGSWIVKGKNKTHFNFRVIVVFYVRKGREEQT